MNLASSNQAAILGSSFEKYLAAQKPFNGFEITCLGKSGQIVVFENNAVPVFDDQENWQDTGGLPAILRNEKSPRKHSKKAVMTCTPVLRKRLNL